MDNFSYVPTKKGIVTNIQVMSLMVKQATNTMGHFTTMKNFFWESSCNLFRLFWKHNFLENELIMKIYLLLILTLGVSCNFDKTHNPNTIESNLNKNFKTISEVINYWKSQHKLEYYKNEVFDLNYDSNDDVAIYFHGNGTGVFNLMKIYQFEKECECYVLNEQLSDLVNPSFYIDSSIITGFYIGHGGGYGISYQWKNNKWDTLNYLSFDPYEIEPQWIVTKTNFSDKNVTIMKTENTMIPEDSILINDY